MNAELKATLIVVAKNAVNAGLLAGAQVFHSPQDHNFHSRHGLYGIGWVILSAVVAREALVWVPKLLAWSSTGDEKPAS